MEEWKEYKLGEVTISVRDRIETSCLDSSSYISTENMLPDKAGVTLSSGIPAGNAIKFEKGDVLISNIRPYFKKIWRANKVGGCSADVICLRASSEVDTLFLYYLLSQDLFFDYVMQGAKGTKMPRGDKNQIMQWPISIPNITLQKKIASILSTLDDKIEVNRRINENLEQQAQALFKSWFVDFEPFKDQPFVESELGLIPQGWKVGVLSEIADIIMGTSPSGSSYNTEGEGDVFYQGRAEFGFRFPERNLYTTEAKRFADVDSVLVSVRAPVGDVNVAEEKCCIGRGLASVKSKKGCNSFILYLMQNLKPVFDRFNGEGTVFGSINKKAFEDLMVVVPDENVILKFDSIASLIDSQIKRTEQESRRLAELRDTLLPRLMSGELHVNDMLLSEKR